MLSERWTVSVLGVDRLSFILGLLCCFVSGVLYMDAKRGGRKRIGNYSLLGLSLYK